MAKIFIKEEELNISGKISNLHLIFGYFSTNEVLDEDSTICVRFKGYGYWATAERMPHYLIVRNINSGSFCIYGNAGRSESYKAGESIGEVEDQKITEQFFNEPWTKHTHIEHYRKMWEIPEEEVNN